MAYSPNESEDQTVSSSGGSVNERTVTLHMVSSLDGFIAKPDNSVAWMETKGVYEAGVSISEEEVASFLKGIDCYVMGSRTYEHALELGWPYGDTPVIVVSSREWPSAKAITPDLPCRTVGEFCHSVFLAL